MTSWEDRARYWEGQAKEAIARAEKAEAAAYQWYLSYCRVKDPDGEANISEERS